MALSLLRAVTVMSFHTSSMVLLGVCEMSREELEEDDLEEEDTILWRVLLLVSWMLSCTKDDHMRD